MPQHMYTEKEHAQYRGPTTSDNYNKRIENLYKDLVYLYNKVGIAEEDMRLIFQRIIKDHFYLGQVVEDLEARLQTLEDGENKFVFRSAEQIDNDNEMFIGQASYEIDPVDTLSLDTLNGLLTLPKVESNSFSKINFTNSNGDVVLPSSFEALVQGENGTADSSGALIDSSDIYNAFLPVSGKVWERNVVVDSTNINGAVVHLYVRLPVDLSINETSNVVKLNPFPMMGCNILEVAYTTKFQPLLNETDAYQPLNNSSSYFGNSEAVGWLPPGGWEGDAIINAGPKAFYFDPRPITAIKVTLEQKNYFTESTKYIYSYGLANLDVRYDKFLDEGRTILRFDAPPGKTISSVDNVLPQIYNVSAAELPRVFNYRVIWNNNGVPVEDPVAFSQSVWIEIGLKKTLRNSTPALSGLIVSYS